MRWPSQRPRWVVVCCPECGQRIELTDSRQRRVALLLHAFAHDPDLLADLMDAAARRTNPPK